MGVIPPDEMDFSGLKFKETGDHVSNSLFQIAIVALAVVLFFGAGITWIGTHMINKNLRTRVEVLETELAEQKLQFETFKTVTDAEFRLTWQSLARAHANYKALGLGYHLEEEDIADDNDGTSDSSDGEMQ